MVPLLSMRPTLLPLEFRIVPSDSTLPTEDPLRFRTVPSLSMRPTDEPEEFRTVPSSSMRPSPEPLELRTVPSESMLPTDDPLPLRTVKLHRSQANAGEILANSINPMTTTIATPNLFRIKNLHGFVGLVVKILSGLVRGKHCRHFMIRVGDQFVSGMRRPSILASKAVYR